MCFQNNGKTAQAAKFIKSIIMTKVIGSVLLVDTFKRKCVVLKGVLQSPRLKYHVKTFGIDQSFSNNALFEHKWLQNIKKLYKHDGKCEYQQKFKYILDAAMVLTPDGVQPKMSPTISFSGMYRKSFICRRNSTNYQ